MIPWLCSIELEELSSALGRQKALLQVAKQASTMPVIYQTDESCI
jgi:hypothetical protein